MSHTKRKLIPVCISLNIDGVQGTAGFVLIRSYKMQVFSFGATLHIPLPVWCLPNMHLAPQLAYNFWIGGLLYAKEPAWKHGSNAENNKLIRVRGREISSKRFNLLFAALKPCCKAGSINPNLKIKNHKIAPSCDSYLNAIHYDHWALNSIV